MITRILRIFSVEFYKLIRQRLFYVALFLLCITVLGSIFADKLFSSGKDPVSGFTILAQALLNGFKIGAILILIFSSLTVAGEMTAGTMKMVLIRPYRRSEWLCARILVLCALILITVLVIELLGTAIAWQLYGFKDVTDPLIQDYVHLQKAVMLRYMLYSFVLVFIPLLTIAFLGLLVSTVVREVGSAVALAILIYLALEYLLGGFFDNLAPYSFTYYLDWYLATWRDLSQGILGDINRFQAIDKLIGWGVTVDNSTELSLIPFLKSIFIPLGYSCLFGISSWLLFRRKDILV
jgi:ABC-2 type transport system permease protein